MLNKSKIKLSSTFYLMKKRYFPHERNGPPTERYERRNELRIKEAREARGLTGVTLAELVGVKRASISQYELGNASPKFDVLQKLATVLNVPRAFFLRPLAQPDTDSLFYRSMSAATKSDRLKASRKYSWLKQLTTYLRGYNSPANPDWMCRLTIDTNAIAPLL